MASKPPLKSEESESTNPNNWSEFYSVISKFREKFLWVFALAGAIFTLGYQVGSYKSSVDHRFEINQLKTDHSEKIQNIRDEYRKEEIRTLKDTQERFLINAHDERSKNEN